MAAPAMVTPARQAKLRHMRSHILGRTSEELAAGYLAQRGYTILARNYRAGHKEIDIIAVRDEVIAFVEVKARVAGTQAHPLEAITWKKRRELAAAARVWLSQNRNLGTACQFDAIAITWSGQSHVIEHIPNAWLIR